MAECLTRRRSLGLIFVLYEPPANRKQFKKSIVFDKCKFHSNPWPRSAGITIQTMRYDILYKHIQACYLASENYQITHALYDETKLSILQQFLAPFWIPWLACSWNIRILQAEERRETLSWSPRYLLSMQVWLILVWFICHSTVWTHTHEWCFPDR